MKFNLNFQIEMKPFEVEILKIIDLNFIQYLYNFKFKLLICSVWSGMRSSLKKSLKSELNNLHIMRPLSFEI